MKVEQQASDQPKWSIRDYTCEQFADWVEQKRTPEEIEALTHFQRRLIGEWKTPHGLETLRYLKGLPASRRNSLFGVANKLRKLLTLPRAKFNIGGRRQKGVRYSEALRQLGKMHGHVIHRFGSAAFILAEEEKL